MRTSFPSSLASGRYGIWLGLASHGLVESRACERTRDRRQEVDPEVGPLGCDERGAERSRWVHRRAGDAAAEQRVEADGAADRDRRCGADGPRVGGDGHDHEHQERGQDELVGERGAGADGRDGGAQVGRGAVPDEPERSAPATAPTSCAGM